MADVAPTVADPDTLVSRGEDPEIRPDRRVHSSLGVFHRLWPWGCLGLVGSLLVALAGPRIVNGGAIPWWYHPTWPASRSANLVALYVGMGALSAAWLGLGRVLAGPRGVRQVELWIIGALWLVPLALGPALFSRDVYSYLAQGTILHLGLSPYHDAPVVLGHLGHAHLLQAVSPFWRHTTAPYGPLFLALISLIASISGSNLIVGVLLVRITLLLGIVLLVVFIPRLAAALGADPVRATWLAILSPLVLLELVAAGHNDALMIGLLVAGVTLALERHPLLGIAACAVAATIKVPAALGAVFIAVAWARALPTPRARVRFLATGALTGVGVMAAVSLATGLGVSWISTSLFSTPAKVRLAITPATGLDGRRAAPRRRHFGQLTWNRIGARPGRGRAHGRARSGPAVARAAREHGALPRSPAAGRGRRRPRRVAVVFHLGVRVAGGVPGARALARACGGRGAVRLPGQAVRDPRAAPGYGADRDRRLCRAGRRSLVHLEARTRRPRDRRPSAKRVGWRSFGARQILIPVAGEARW
jgi:hypothetical protein